MVESQEQASSTRKRAACSPEGGTTLYRSCEGARSIFKQLMPDDKLAGQLEWTCNQNPPNPWRTVASTESSFNAADHLRHLAFGGDLEVPRVCKHDRIIHHICPPHGMATSPEPGLRGKHLDLTQSQALKDQQGSLWPSAHGVRSTKKKLFAPLAVGFTDFVLLSSESHSKIAARSALGLRLGATAHQLEGLLRHLPFTAAFLALNPKKTYFLLQAYEL